MTDSNQAPNQSPNSSPGYEGSDPDLPDRQARQETPRLGVTTVQVSASAAASVTSALAASFFGVAGTLIGAAVGSIVSTIAGALYTEYLRRAGERIRGTRNVVIQRIPSEVLATTPLRRLTRPTDLPGQPSLQPIGSENSDETVAVPVQDPAQLRRRPEGMAPLDQTTVMPSVGSPGAAGSPPVPPRPLWKRPMVAMAAVSAAGFMIALGVVLSSELLIGHPISGGDSGTTLTKLTSTSQTEDTPTEEEAPAPTETAEPAATETAQVPVPTATTDPTETGGTETIPTDEPATEATEPGTEATDPGTTGDGSEGDSGAADSGSGAAGDAEMQATPAP